MESLTSLEEYKDLLKEVKTITKRPFSNIYFSLPALERFIGLDRVGYEKTDAGVLFYIDEEAYYRVYLYVDLNKELKIGKQDKRLYCRYIYRQSEKQDLHNSIQKVLTDNGFIKEGISVELQADPKEYVRNYSYLERYISSMEKKGYKCIIPDSSRYAEIEQMFLDSGIIKDYHIEFRTEEEKKQLQEGSYLCIVKQDEICAARIATLENGVAHAEDIAVKEQYKLKGLAPILAYQGMKWFCENDIKLMRGWVLVHNQNAMEYYRSMGYQFNNKYSEEWILSAR